MKKIIPAVLFGCIVFAGPAVCGSLFSGASAVSALRPQSVVFPSFRGLPAAAGFGNAGPLFAEESEKPDKILKMVSPIPRYHPVYLDSINDLYVNVLAVFGSDTGRDLLMKVALIAAAVFAVFWGALRYFSRKIQGNWVIDMEILEKHLVHTGASREFIDMFKQRFGGGRILFIVSARKMTLKKGRRRINFPYETISVSGEIATGLVGGRLVVLIWTPARGGESRIISLREANEREIPRYSEDDAFAGGSARR